MAKRFKVQGSTFKVRCSLFTSAAESAAVHRPARRNACPSSRSLPRQHPFLPCPDQSFSQQQQKYHHRNKRAGRQSGEGDRERQKEDRFHVEDQKDDGIEVILGFEVYPGVALRLQAAFVSGILVRAGFERRKLLRTKASEARR